MQSTTDKHYKILLTGSSKSGKSSIINSFLGQTFTQITNPTEGIQYRSKIVKVDGINVNLQILDTSGLKSFQTVKKLSYKGINVIILVFDLTDMQSSSQIMDQIEQILLKDLCSYDCAAILVGNKKDLIQGIQRVVPLDLSNTFGDIIGQYMQVSAKNGENIQNLFLQAVRLRLRFDSQDQNVRSMYQKVMQSLQKPQYAQYKETFLKQKQKNSTAAPAPNNIQQTIQTKKPPIIKVLFVGQAQVGKTSMMTHYSELAFSDAYFPTIGVDFRMKQHQLDNVRYKVQLWDTAGLSKFRVLTHAYYRPVQVFFIVYDLTKRQTFQRLEQFILKIFKQNLQTNRYICLIGNKTDLNNRAVSTQQGMALAQKHKIEFMQISAKNRQQIDYMISKAIKFIHDHKQ